MALKFLRSYTVVLAAGAARTLDVVGDYFLVISSTQTEFNVAFDNGPHIAFQQGFSGKVSNDGEPYEAVTIHNPNGSSLTVVLALGFGELWDNKATISGSVAVKAGGDAFTEQAVSVGTSAVELLAANTNRTSAVIRAGSSDLTLGPTSGVTALTPATIPAGASMTIAHTGAVYGIRAAGTANAGVYEETA